jgi:hypothetical protein
LVKTLSKSNTTMAAFTEETQRSFQTTFFPTQEKEGDRIVAAFDAGALITTFVAPVQWGKTGVLLYVSKKMVETENVAGYSNVYIITGMSDNEWRTQTRARVMPKMRKNVLHRGNLMKVAKSIPDIRDALFIVDESHIGSLAGSTLHRFFGTIGIYEENAMRERNLRILQTSATPEISLFNAQFIPGGMHSLVKADISVPSYLGIGNIIKSSRMNDPYDMVNDGIQGIFEFIGKSIAELDTPKYHLVRINGRRKDERRQFSMWAKQSGYALRLHDSSANKKSKISDDELEEAPVRHTIILVKNMWRAAKTIPYQHIGSVVSGFSTSAAVEAQGLVGRICGHNKNHNIKVLASLDQLRTYEQIMEDERNDYPESIHYISSNLRIKDGAYRKIGTSYLHPHNFAGAEFENVVLPQVAKRTRGISMSTKYTEGEHYTIERKIYSPQEGENTTTLFKRVKATLKAKWVHNPYKAKSPAVKTADEWMNAPRLINQFKLDKEEKAGKEKYIFKCATDEQGREALFVAKIETLVDF